MLTRNGARDKSENECLRSVAKIECGRNEGTAVCVHSSDNADQTFLTCAHVVQHKTQSVILRRDGHVFKGKAVYATPKGYLYDIAVIIVAGGTADIIRPCQISDKIPTVDQKVFAAGYAYGEHVPSTVSGNVLVTSFSVLMTTCDVCIGYSGGPVFATNSGQLLGLTVGKSSVGTVNFALPSTEFVKTIYEYYQTDDVKILNRLESKRLVKKILWNNGSLILCHI